MRPEIVLKFSWVLCAAAMSARLGAAEDATKLSRSRALEEALAHNPQIASAQAQVEQARAGIAQATAFPDPAFVWDFTQQKSLRDFGSAQSRDVGATFTVPFPDKFRLNRRVAEAALSAAELSLRQTRELIASQTATAFDAVLVAESQLENDRESERLSQDVLQKTQARYDAGTVARLDVLQARVNFSQARNQTIADERAAMTARAALTRLLARPSGSPVEPAGPLEPPPEAPPLSDLLRLAEDRRPEIASLRAQREGARFAAKLAREFWFPDLSVTVLRNQTVGFPAAFSTAGSIGVPLFFWQHEKGDVAAAEARRIQLAADETAARAQVDLDVRTAYAAADTARRQALWIRDDLLPQAREAFRVASDSYELGGSSAVDLINAKVALLAATTQLTQALGAANDAAAQLELAVGAPVPSASTEGVPHVP